MIRIAAQLVDTRAVVRRIQFGSGATPASIAACVGCSQAAIVHLVPFFVDDNFVTVLASADRRLSGADLIHVLRTRSVRKPSGEEILLGLQLGRRRHTVYADETLFDHDEVLFCIEPPSEWIATDPRRLCSELGARSLAIPSR